MALAALAIALVLVLLGVFVLKALLVFGIVAAVIGFVLLLTGYTGGFTRRFRRR